MADILTMEGCSWTVLALQETEDKEKGPALPAGTERRMMVAEGQLLLCGSEPAAPEFTGRLLICRDLLHRYYSRAPWAYQESRELVFEAGKLVQSADVGEQVRTARSLLYDPDRQDDLLDLAADHWWLRVCLGLSRSGETTDGRRTWFL